MAHGTLLNQAVGSYRLIDFIGAGGMGEVYRGIDKAHNRIVALKVLNVTKTAPNAIERFRNEARIHGGVRHPNIATMYEYLEFDGAPCIAMEYIDGETIDERLRSRGALPLKQALEIFERIVDAVGYLHSRGIIHRDIKSNNVKLSESGAVKVLDFGIAKSADSPRLTVSGAMIGTPQYVSPEQLHGDPADERTDIWALGVLLYEMLTGRLPFEGGSMAAVMDRVGKASYPAPTRVNPALPREIDRVVGLCLKAKPEQRYQSAEALLSDLRAQHEEAPRTTPANSWSLARLRSSGEMRAAAARRLPMIGAMGAATVAFAFLVYAVFSKPGPAVITPGADTAIVNITPSPGGTGKDTSATAQRPGAAVREIVLTLSEGRAEVYSDTGFVGFTPHVVKAALGDHVSLVLRRDGYEDEPVNFIVTEALIPRFTYSLRPRLSPPGSGAPQPFASRALPRRTSAIQIPLHG
jgi:serine/threonine-protein kinase